MPPTYLGNSISSRNNTRATGTSSARKGLIHSRFKQMMVQKIEYIHNNPVRRGYVDEPRHWRYSTTRNYTGTGGVIEVTTDWS